VDKLSGWGVAVLEAPGPDVGMMGVGGKIEKMEENSSVVGYVQ